jgi:dihydroorotate dehydrogenase
VLSLYVVNSSCPHTIHLRQVALEKYHGHLLSMSFEQLRPSSSPHCTYRRTRMYECPES